MSKDGQHSTGATARSSGRGSLPLIINKNDRKPLFAEKSSRDSIGGTGRGELRPSVGRNAHSDGSALLADAGAGAGANRLGRSVSPTPSMGSSNGDGSSRIPRPASAAGGAFSKARKQITLTEAYRMAEAEEQRGYSPTRFRQPSPVAVDGSPSPAPRPRPVSQGSNDGRANRAFNRGPTDVGKSRRHSRPLGDPIPEDDTRRSVETSSSLSSFERRLSRFAEDQGRSPASPSQRPGSNGHSRIPARLGDNERTLAKKTSDSSLGGSPRPPAFAKGHVPKGWVAHLLAQEEKRATSPQPHQAAWQEAADRPIPSIEGGNPPQEPTPPKSRPTTAGAENPSPNKSYAWQVDQDFTAGDLQISDSPRITTDLAELGGLGVGARRSSNDAAFGHNQGIEVGDPETARGSHPSPRRSGSRRSNTKLDEIWQRERDMERRVAERSERHQVPATNTKLDDIRQREVELQLEPEAEEKRAEHDEERERPRNTKLDEIREREKEFMSKKALASNRLDDIREQNSMSKSLSPEPQTQRNKPAARESTPDKASVGNQEASPGEKGKAGGQGQGQGEQIPDTPITVFRKAGTEAQDKPDDRRWDSTESKESDKPKQQTPHARSDSRELLRRLARATSTSPAPEPKRQPGSPGRDKKDVAAALSNKGEKSSDHSRRGSSERRRPSAADGRRPRRPSTDSTKDKRSSRALSDNDPTDRIEGEMKLFAPGDNQSERGSVRAPSVGPPSEDEDELPEETPRATKKDPLSLPTPKITGAYVETPVTVKVENREEDNEARSEILPVIERDKAAPRASRKSSKDQGALTLSNKSETRPSGLRRRRTRSLPRSRGPLINSAKPPTVRDDLLAIQKTYKIEDSTLDDFEQLFKTGKRAPSPELESVLNEISVRREKIANKPDFDKSDNSELERYDRMSKSLKDGLMGIRTAKLGIERLEGNLAHADQAPKVEELDELDFPVDLPRSRRPEAESSSRKAGLKASSGTTSRVSVKEDEKKRHETDTPRANNAAPKSDIPGVAYLCLPIPRLYRRQPFRFTLLGLLLLLFSIWYAVESATCANYCRPETCNPKRAPCYWSPSDPTWGYAIPVKMDQWLTDGQGREWAHHLATEASDMYLDVWEYVTDTDIRDVDIETLGFYGKRQHRRRLRKKGLIKPRVESPEEKAKWDALHEVRLAMEREQEMREAGYDVGDDHERFGADERI